MNKELLSVFNKLYSEERSSKEFKKIEDTRSEYQRDFDRIIFSSPFRKLQNKTQVFPLPGVELFVHNRLTHSLEVASVGRSLAKLIGQEIYNQYKNNLNEKSKDFYRYELCNVIAAACLCHDIGNPPFGHSGEDAIANYFRKSECYKIEGQDKKLKDNFSNEEWNDLINFEGNANSIRVLTQNKKGNLEGGLRLTYTTLASILKYPCESIAKDERCIYRRKLGFFQSEKNIFATITEKTSMKKNDAHSNCIVYFRHPFAWIVEVADDICYNIMDFEDAHRLKILGNEECLGLFNKLALNLQEFDRSKETIQNELKKIDDKNGKMSYLRAKIINSLIIKAKNVYMSHIEDILRGTLNKSIFDTIQEEGSHEIEEILNITRDKVYNHRRVVTIQIAGHNIMFELLSHFIPPLLKDKNKRQKIDKLAIQLLPLKFQYDNESDSPYTKVLGVLDYISGMTDIFLMDLYKKIKGIEIGMTT